MDGKDSSWFNTWPDGLIGVNKHQRMVEVSPMAHSILGYTREDLYGENPHDILCAKTREDQHGLDMCELSFLDSGNETTSTLWRHKNGHFVSIDFRLITVGYGEASRVISFVDNSTRLHTQAEMEKFSEYVEMSPAPLAEFVMDGQLLFGNNALQELILEYGFDDEGAANAIPKNIRDIGKGLIESHLSYDIAEVRLEDRVFGWHFHILNDDEEPTMVGYAFDITAQKYAEELAREQSSQSRKEFYAKMVHELRSPLNAIVGFSDLLLMDLEDKACEEDLSRLRLIRQAGIQLNEQVTATLDIAKIESGKMSLDISDFAIADVCQEVLEQMSPLAAEKDLEFRFSTVTKQRIFSDRIKVRQIVINLAANAIKFTTAGSVHIVSSEKQDDLLGNCISIAVSDTGIGIKEEQIPRLFQSFEQVEESQSKGTGLGLALVHNMVTLLGGNVSAKSKVGEGSIFEVLLPYLSSHTSSFNAITDSDLNT